MANDLEADVTAVSRIDAVPAILEVICRTTGMGFAAVARVTEDRWIACAVRDEIEFGLQPGGELKVETTICDEIRASGRAVIIDHVAEDEAYRQHHTPAMYGFQSYISIPIFYPDGSFFGTLCAIDPRPARLNRPEIVQMFRLFADLIMFHLQAREQVNSVRADLVGERETAGIREQFIAVLGHDLRTPLASIDAAAEILKHEPLSSKGFSTLKLIQGSVYRMSAMIHDVLDLARIRLGEGIQLVRQETLVQADLEQVIGELKAAWPGRSINAEIDISQKVPCDRSRIGQLFSNILGNALAHGAEDMPIRVNALCRQDTFELSVANQGNPIPAAALGGLFEPFSRYSADSRSKGLGLGLFIASEIARAHGGTLDVSSSNDETSVVFRMPVSGEVGDGPRQK